MTHPHYQNLLSLFSLRLKSLDSAEIACLTFFVLCHEYICAHTCRNAGMYMYTHTDGNLEYRFYHPTNDSFMYKTFKDS